jgi:hypothetical protein
MLGGVLETKPDVEKEEGFEDTTKDTAEVDKDMVKQNKAFFNREEVPEARTGVTRKSNSRHTKNWRLKELTPMLLLMLLHLQVGNHNEVAEVMTQEKPGFTKAGSSSGTGSPRRGMGCLTCMRSLRRGL